jgi:flagellar basal body-associated protein FliL
MKRNYVNNKNGRKNIKKARSTILFIVVALFVIAGSALIAQKFSTNKQAVQAADNNPVQSQDKDSSQNSNYDQEADNSVDKESNSSVENVAYLEKYIEQQIKEIDFGKLPHKSSLCVGYL